MMQGKIDTSFETLQRDLFASGLVAEIGVNAFAVWLAIKSHSDYNTGESWPGMRRLAELTGLALSTVAKCVPRLVDARLLRIARPGKRSRRGNTYVARERMDVRLGDRVLCRIILDYVPATLRLRLDGIDEAVRKGKVGGDSQVFAECEILPGDGFEWDAKSRSLRAAIPAHELPAPGSDLNEEALKAPIVRRALELEHRARKV